MSDCKCRYLQNLPGTHSRPAVAPPHTHEASRDMFGRRPCLLQTDQSRRMLTKLTTCLKRDLWFNVPTDEKTPCSCWLGCHLGSEPTWRWWWGSRAVHRWCLVVCRSAGSQLVGSLAMTSTLQNSCNFHHDFIFIEMVSCSMSRVCVTQSCKGSSPKTFENMWDDQLIQSCADGFMFFLSTVIRGFQEDLY